MKLGISSYSLFPLMQSNEMDIFDVMEWVKEAGGKHIEVVPLGNFKLDSKQFIDVIREKANELGIDISNYAISANFITDNKADYEKEIERVLGQVDIAHQLGAKFMRHDVAMRPAEESSIIQFEQDYEKLVDACRQIADYAKPYDIITSIENHGRYIQKSDRIQSLVHGVNRSNFRTTLDVGNFLGVDENPVTALMNNLSIASVIHLKDFYYRPSNRNPGEGFSKTISNQFLRPAIVGHGDIDMYEVIKVIKQSGYDGYISIEFEGMEENRTGTKVGFNNALRIWNEV